MAEHLSQHVGEGLRLASLGGVQNGGLHASGERLAEQLRRELHRPGRTGHGEVTARSQRGHGGTGESEGLRERHGLCHKCRI